jgi:long-subunit fatty acid transport protein
MKTSNFQIYPKLILAVLTLLFSMGLFAQGPTNKLIPPSNFWRNVQFGGGIGVGIGSGFTNISISPSAIYNLNEFFSAGLGLQYSYLNQKNSFTSSQYGGSIIGLINPFPEIQLSVELEQLQVNTTSSVALAGANVYPKSNFWNTGLFLGAGYRTQNITVGARYNVLFDKNKNVYGDAFMPFVRVYF